MGFGSLRNWRGAVTLMWLLFMSGVGVLLLLIGSVVAHLFRLSSLIDGRYADGVIWLLDKLARPLDIIDHRIG